MRVQQCVRFARYARSLSIIYSMFAEQMDWYMCTAAVVVIVVVGVVFVVVCSHTQFSVTKQ